LLLKAPSFLRIKLETGLALGGDLHLQLLEVDAARVAEIVNLIGSGIIITYLFL